MQTGLLHLPIIKCQFKVLYALRPSLLVFKADVAFVLHFIVRHYQLNSES